MFHLACAGGGQVHILPGTTEAGYSANSMFELRSQLPSNRFSFAGGISKENIMILLIVQAEEQKNLLLCQFMLKNLVSN